MAQRISIHPDNPQPRLLAQCAARMNGGALVAMPTDASYVLCCRMDQRAAVDRMRALRRLDDKHLLTLICQDLSELAQYAQVDNRQYRFLREWTPGAYTFILPATREVPRRLWHPSRRTVGLRVPDSPTVLGLIAALGQPLLASSLIPPGEDEPMTDPDDIDDRFGSQIDLIVDGESGRFEPTTVIDMTGDEPVVVREGRGPVDRMVLPT